MHNEVFRKLVFTRLPPDEMKQRSALFFDELKRRRSVRSFSGDAVGRDIIENAIKAASTAPSGANKQPWHFVAISKAQTKKEIRIAAEKEEVEFYERRASEKWLADLAQFGTDANKPFLEEAPYLIAIFLQKFNVDAQGNKGKNYYTAESVGIATGMLITALHHAGLATLTHTPSPMKFLNHILGRPEDERPYMLLVTGYPSEDAKVPSISKRPFSDVCTFVE